MKKKTILVGLLIVIALGIGFKLKNQELNKPWSNLINNASSTNQNPFDNKPTSDSENKTNNLIEDQNQGFTINTETINSTATDTSKIKGDFICQAKFPIYTYYHNDNVKAYFYEDAFKTYLYTEDPDGTKTYSLSEKNSLNKTDYYTVDPDGTCTGYTNESTDPKSEPEYNPFACDQDEMLYGFCPITNFSKSILVWKNSNKKDLNNQLGRAYGKYLIPGDSSTLLSEATHWLVPKIPTAKYPTSYNLPLPDHTGETFTYKIEPGDSIDSIANKFGLKIEDIYNSTPSIPAEFALKTCLRVKDKKSPYRIYCIDTQICQNVGENTIQPVVNNPFSLEKFKVPNNCKLEN